MSALIRAGAPDERRESSGAGKNTSRLRLARHCHPFQALSAIPQVVQKLVVADVSIAYKIVVLEAMLLASFARLRIGTCQHAIDSFDI